MHRSPLSLFLRFYFWLAERLYHELSWAYDLVSWLVSFGQWDTWRRWALDYLRGERLLEIGFGTGELLIAVARKKKEIYGLELSPQMQKVTAQKLKRLGMTVPRVRGASLCMPFQDQSFDTVVSTFPAGYIFAPETWQEVARLLKDGGRFVILGIWYSYTYPPVYKLNRFLWGPPPGNTMRKLQQLAQEAGLNFRVIIRKQKYVEVPIILAEKGTIEALPDAN